MSRRNRRARKAAALMLVLGGVIGTAGLAPTGPAAADGDDNPGRYQVNGDLGGFLNVMPPGADGVINAEEAAAAAAAGGTLPEHVDDQLELYASLADAGPGVTDDDLLDYFKDASFGVATDDIEREYAPGDRTDVTVLRDGFGVPHIYGTTREGTMFASGYTTAEDRLWLMDLFRNAARGRLSEFFGLASLASADRDQIIGAPYTEAELKTQYVDWCELGDDQRAICDDVEAYVAGVNAYIDEAIADPDLLPAEYAQRSTVPDEWTTADAVAQAALISAQFGQGGGRELANACAQDDLATTLGTTPGEATTIFDALTYLDSSQAPSTSTEPAPYLTDLGPVDPDAVPRLDCATLQAPAGGPLDEAVTASAGGAGAGGPSADAIFDALGLTEHASNALLVAGEHTTEGVPIMVAGPQIGYRAPQSFVEKDVHGPGIDVRGAAFPGSDVYLQVGRGRGFAWSPTSASADIVDHWVLRLCNPDATAAASTTVDETALGYTYDDECERIETFDHTLRYPDGTSTTWTVERSPRYGPIVSRGRLVDGTPIAVARQRSTYAHELDTLLGLRKLNDAEFMLGGYPAFREAIGDIGQTFNWFYVDDEHIGYVHSCRCPNRAEGVDPRLPMFGDGTADWDGFLALADQPQALDPETGTIVNWNNVPAPGFGAADSNDSYGPIHRSQLIEQNLQAALADGPVDRGILVDVMEQANLVDTRALVVPIALDVMGDAAPTDADPQSAALRQALVAWLDDGGLRHDGDGDGVYDHGLAVATVDAWWTHLRVAVLPAPDGRSLLDIAGVGPSAKQYADDAGAIFDELTAISGGTPSVEAYGASCGGGSLNACSGALWDSLDATVADLTTAFASADPATWLRTVADDAIVHQVIGAITVDPIPWQNRSTFQQVVQVGVAVPGIPETAAAVAGTALVTTATTAPAPTITVATTPTTLTATTALASQPAAVDRDSNRGRTILIAMGALVVAAIAGIAAETRRARRKASAASAAAAAAAAGAAAAAAPAPGNPSDTADTAGTAADAGDESGP